MASYGKAVTGTAVMARSANEEKKKSSGGEFKNAARRDFHICTEEGAQVLNGREGDL